MSEKKHKYANLPLWLSLLCAFAVGLKQLREPDVWWQILAGKWMLQHGAVTRSDMFSYTMPGVSWTNVKWLYEVIIAAMTNVSGPEGLIMLQALVNVSIVYFMVRAAKLIAKHFSQLPSAASLALPVLFFLAITEYRMAGRPEMVSHLLTAVYLYLFWRNPAMHWKGLLWFIPLQCLWANMHEGYPVGIVIIGAFAGGSVLAWAIDRDKEKMQQAGRAIALLFACILVILANPNTVKLWQQPFEIYRQVWANKYTTELYSWRNPEYWTVQAKAHILLLVLAVGYWVVKLLPLFKNKRLVSLSAAHIGYLLLLVGTGYLSLTANRNIPFTQIILYPTIVLMLAETGLLLSRQGNSNTYKMIAVSVIAVIFYISIVNNSFYKASGSVNRYGVHVNMLHNPTGAAAFIKKHNIQGPAFSDYFISSYLLWDMYPAFRSYIDLRDLDIFPEPFFDEYFSLYTKPEKFYNLDSQYHFNYVVLSNSQLVGLQQMLYWKEGYNMVYADPVSVIFLKMNEQNKAINGNLAIQKLFTWPEPAEDPAWAAGFTKLLNPLASYEEDEDSRYQPIHAALFYNQLMNYPLAIKMLAPQLGTLEDVDAYNTMGKIYSDYAARTSDAALKARRADTANRYYMQASEIK